MPRRNWVQRQPRKPSHQIRRHKYSHARTPADESKGFTKVQSTISRPINQWWQETPACHLIARSQSLPYGLIFTLSSSLLFAWPVHSVSLTISVRLSNKREVAPLTFRRSLKSSVFRHFSREQKRLESCWRLRGQRCCHRWLGLLRRSNSLS